MRKLFIIINFILLSNSFLSQTSVDTLVLATHKYLLFKTKIFHSTSQTGPVALPSEYREDANLPFLTFKYKAVNDKNTYPYWDNLSHLSSVADTIFMSANEFRTLRPYIKSKGKKIFFCASKVDKIYNDTITIAAHSYVKEGAVLSFYQPYIKFSDSDIEKLKQATFILRELYYAKGNATFYLDRKFVLKIK